MEDRECAMQRMEQGTIPSWAGERSVVLTKHQSGLSWSRSKTSTVWPRRTVSSPLLLPLLATKSWITTVSSQPPESCDGRSKWSLNRLIFQMQRNGTGEWNLLICSLIVLDPFRCSRKAPYIGTTRSCQYQHSSEWTVIEWRWNIYCSIIIMFKMKSEKTEM